MAGSVRPTTPSTPPEGGPREVAIVAYRGVQSLDVTGPLEVFAGAQLLAEGGRAGSAQVNGDRAGGDRRGDRADSGRRGADHADSDRQEGDRGYRVSVLSVDGAPVRTSSGLTIAPHLGLQDVSRAIDTLIVAGGPGSRQAREDAVLLEWIASQAPTARRVASVCTGAFVLAAAGVLDGRRATTHWAAAAALARRHPQIHVDPEPIFVRDGHVWTSAGVTAGMDLALAMVEEDIDREAALTIARHLVLFLRRPGNQSQFSATLAAHAPARTGLREAQRYAVEHLDGDLSVQELAARASMSARHFARSFHAEVGVTPARYVERLRLEAARRRLEEGEEPLAAVAAACGFGTAETMRRTFLRALGVGPAEYRRRFHTSATAAPEAAA